MASFENCTIAAVTASDVYKAYFREPWSTAVFITAIICALLTYVIFFMILRVIYSSTEFGGRRLFLVRLFGIFPVYSITAMAGILVPRASNIAKWGSSMYLAHTIYTFLLLIMDYYGGPQAMIEKLTAEPISIARAPLACCFSPCLPDVQLDVKRFHLVRYFVLQVTIIRPACVFVNAVLWADGMHPRSFVNPAVSSLYLNGITMVSTFIAIYGLQIFYNASLKHLTEYSIKPKFAMLQVVMLTTNIQSLVFNIFYFVDILPCIGPWNAMSRADTINSILKVYEMFAFSTFFALLHVRQSRQQTRGFGAPTIQLQELPSKTDLDDVEDINGLSMIHNEELSVSDNDEERTTEGLLTTDPVVTLGDNLRHSQESIV